MGTVADRKRGPRAADHRRTRLEPRGTRDQSQRWAKWLMIRMSRSNAAAAFWPALALCTCLTPGRLLLPCGFGVRHRDIQVDEKISELRLHLPIGFPDARAERLQHRLDQLRRFDEWLQGLTPWQQHIVP